MSPHESGYRWECAGRDHRSPGSWLRRRSDVTYRQHWGPPSWQYTARVMALGDGEVHCDSDWSVECLSRCLRRLLAPTRSLELRGASACETVSEPSPTLTWTNVDNEAGYEWEVRTIYQTPIAGGHDWA